MEEESLKNPKIIPCSIALGKTLPRYSGINTITADEEKIDQNEHLRDQLVKDLELTINKYMNDKERMETMKQLKVMKVNSILPNSNSFLQERRLSEILSLSLAKDKFEEKKNLEKKKESQSQNLIIETNQNQTNKEDEQYQPQNNDNEEGGYKAFSENENNDQSTPLNKTQQEMMEVNEEGGYKPFSYDEQPKNEEGGYKAFNKNENNDQSTPLNKSQQEIMEVNEEGFYKTFSDSQNLKDYANQSNNSLNSSGNGYILLKVEENPIDIKLDSRNYVEEMNNYTMLDNNEIDKYLEESGYSSNRASLKSRASINKMDFRKKGYIKKSLGNAKTMEVTISNDHEFLRTTSPNNDIAIKLDKKTDNTVKISHSKVNDQLNQFHECLKVLGDHSTRTYEIRMRTYNQISSITNDFLHDSEQYGKIIIREIGIPVENKTIKPINKGGILGGEKCKFFFFATF